MGKYWNKIWKNNSTKSYATGSGKKEPSAEEKLEVAFQEIDLLKKRILLLERAIEQQVINPPSSSSTNDYSYFSGPASSYYSTKSLPRYLHHIITPSGSPPDKSQTDGSPVVVISAKKGPSVKASVKRHRIPVENNHF